MHNGDSDERSENRGTLVAPHGEQDEDEILGDGSNEQNPEQNNFEKLYTEWSAIGLGRRIDHVLNILIFAAAVAAAIFYYGQLEAMREGLALTRKSNELTQRSNNIGLRALQASQRAWVLTDDVTPSEIKSPTTMINVAFKNFGNSPAIDIRVVQSVRTYRADEAFVEGLMISTKPTAAQAVLAQQQSAKSVTKMDFSESLISTLNAGGWILEVRGMITYRDRLLGIQHTRYCRKWRPASADDPPKWSFCAGFNYPDETRRFGHRRGDQSSDAVAPGHLGD